MKHLILLVLSIAAGGCARTSGGESVAIYRWNTTPVVVTAPLAGRYVLLAAGNEEPKAEVDVKQGEPLGFRRETPDSITAVAGQRTFKVADADLVWRRK
jgi:hypothetical protein